MKKSIVTNRAAGILDILLGVGFLVLAVLFFVAQGAVMGILAAMLSVFEILSFDLVFFILYLTLGIFVILGIMLIVYGSLTLVYMKKELGEFYKKKGKLVFFLISDILCFAFFTALFIILVTQGYIDILAIIIASILLLIIILRIIGLIQYCKGKKIIPQAIEEKNNIPILNEYNDPSVDLVTKLHRLNALKDSGDITEKEYVSIKSQLLQDDK